jgi:hypothetical protein
MVWALLFLKNPGSTLAHLVAQGGEIESLEQEVTKRKDIVHANDENGWTVSSLRIPPNARLGFLAPNSHELMTAFAQGCTRRTSGGCEIFSFKRYRRSQHEDRWRRWYRIVLGETDS